MALDVLTPVVDAPAPTSNKKRSRWQSAWSWLWPKALAVALVIGVWQLVYWSNWKPDYVFPSPATTFSALFDMIGTERFWSSVATTLRRAMTGFALALVVGTLIGVMVARVRPLRLAIGALITGLQTMPSIVWFPFAILLFGLNENAIMFVVILGAAPSIANGVISGIDQVPPQFIRLGKVLGARNVTMYRHIVLPAILPNYLGGLTQGWAFAWRSLMAGELLVIIATRPSLGGTLEYARQLAKVPELFAMMIVILILGMLVDGLFSSAAARVRRRRGFTD